MLLIQRPYAIDDNMSCLFMYYDVLDFLFSFTIDVGILTLTRYILLDPILLFFVMGSVLGMIKFHSCKERYVN